MELIEANAEEVPLPDASFDLALSEYGASIWCDPYKWIPEAARLLRPGGELVFLRNSTLMILCAPDDGEGRRAAPSAAVRNAPARVVRTRAKASSSSCRTASGFGCFVRAGSTSKACGRFRLPRSAKDHQYYDFVSAEWARKWPAEEIWKARKRG